MSWIPGWDSIESAGWWSNFYFGAGICALLCLGVFEVISHRYSLRKDELTSQQQDETQRRHDEEIARLHLETAEANAKAESERLARVKIEERLAPRRLTDPQSFALGDKLKPFGIDTADLFLFGETAEGIQLIGPISFALSTAGWRTRIWHVQGGGFFGVLVQSSTDATDADRNAVDALVEGLNKEGIQTRRQSTFDRAHWYPNVIGPPVPEFADRARIRVLVGTKPQ
jgi:hypothetical protein